MLIDELFEQRKATPTDINEHLETLKAYASECTHVTELGMGEMNSTIALCAGRPQNVVTYDVMPQPFAKLQPLKTACSIAGVGFTYMSRSAVKYGIDQTDLLFIDTRHIYEQLKQELTLAPKVNKYIIMHDTTTFEFVGEKKRRDDPNEYKGLWPAIEEFLEENDQWTLRERHVHNNGLTILEKRV